MALALFSEACSLLGACGRSCILQLATTDGKLVLIRDAKTYQLPTAKTAGGFACKGSSLSVGWHDGPACGNAPKSLGLLEYVPNRWLGREMLKWGLEATCPFTVGFV